MKIGFLISHLGPSQLAFHFLSNSYKYLSNKTDADIVAFVSNQVKPWQIPTFASMNINEAFDFDGIVVATDLYTAEKLSKFPGPRQRYFYVWDLDWMRGSCKWTFEELSDIYNDRQLKLIARSDDHKRIIEQCWNRRIHQAIPNCDIEAFVEMAKRDDKK